MVLVVIGLAAASGSAGTSGAGGTTGAMGAIEAEGGSGGGVVLRPGGRETTGGRDAVGAEGAGPGVGSLSCTCPRSPGLTWIVPPGSGAFGSSCDTFAG
jgi:hypothetical protein